MVEKKCEYYSLWKALLFDVFMTLILVFLFTQIALLLVVTLFLQYMLVV